MKRHEQQVAEEILGLLGGASHLQRMLGLVSISAVRDPAAGLQITHLAHHHIGLPVDGFRVLLEDPNARTYVIQTLRPFYRPTREEIQLGVAAWADKLAASQAPISERHRVREERVVPVIERMVGVALRLPMVRPLPTSEWAGTASML